MIHRVGEFVKKEEKNSIMMCMSIINARDSVAYIILNIVQPNNDKINNLVLKNEKWKNENENAWFLSAIPPKNS